MQIEDRIVELYQDDGKLKPGAISTKIVWSSVKFRSQPVVTVTYSIWVFTGLDI